MCFANSRVNGLRRWNWDGERIIHDSIVPSSRPVVMQQTGWYDIDVREFLVSKDNALMRRTLEGDIRMFIAKLDGASWDLFLSRESGSFDLRAYVITEFVSKKVEYRHTEGLDPWQFPDETLSPRSGDCEDRALLIASMLLASGISSFNVRVALGKFRAWFGRKHEDIDHVWVMYKDEAGKWQVIEPAARVARTKKTGKKEAKQGKMPDSAEYIPFFIFNDVHLWTMQSHTLYEGKEAVRLKRDWSKLDPSFAGWVHKTILNEALTPDVCPDWVLASLNRHFTSVLGKRSLTVDDMDLPGGYDPRDHFDNGYIEESWKLEAGSNSAGAIQDRRRTKSGPVSSRRPCHRRLLKESSLLLRSRPTVSTTIFLDERHRRSGWSWTPFPVENRFAFRPVSEIRRVL